MTTHMSMCVNGVTSYRETAWYINRTHCLTFKQPNDENTLVNLKAKQSFLRDAMKAKVKNIFVSGRSNNPKFIWWLLDYLFFWSEFVLYSSKLLQNFVWFFLLTKIWQSYYIASSLLVCICFLTTLTVKKNPSVCRWRGSHCFLTFSIHLLTSTKLGT